MFDINRPDINGVPPKMQAIADQVKTALEGSIPFLNVETDDNIASNVVIQGTLNPKEEWYNGIFHNGMYFILCINPIGRYYNAGEKVTVKLIAGKFKFRKYTAEPEKVVKKIKEWLEKVKGGND